MPLMRSSSFFSLLVTTGGGTNAFWASDTEHSVKPTLRSGSTTLGWRNGCNQGVRRGSEGGRKGADRRIEKPAPGRPCYSHVATKGGPKGVQGSPKWVQRGFQGGPKLR
eukprot:1196346-Prorocentrum_minimum.AAC.7